MMPRIRNTTNKIVTMSKTHLRGFSCGHPGPPHSGAPLGARSAHRLFTPGCGEETGRPRHLRPSPLVRSRLVGR